MCSKDGRDQGNVKITVVKKTELKMRPNQIDRDALGQSTVLQENMLEGRTSQERFILWGSILKIS